jgi:hypothetical protein
MVAFRFVAELVRVQPLPPKSHDFGYETGIVPPEKDEFPDASVFVHLAPCPNRDYDG